MSIIDLITLYQNCHRCTKILLCFLFLQVFTCKNVHWAKNWKLLISSSQWNSRQWQDFLNRTTRNFGLDLYHINSEAQNIYYWLLCVYQLYPQIFCKYHYIPYGLSMLLLITELENLAMDQYRHCSKVIMSSKFYFFIPCVQNDKFSQYCEQHPTHQLFGHLSLRYGIFSGLN